MSLFCVTLFSRIRLDVLFTWSGINDLYGCLLVQVLMSDSISNKLISNLLLLALAALTNIGRGICTHFQIQHTNTDIPKIHWSTQLHVSQRFVFKSYLGQQNVAHSVFSWHSFWGAVCLCNLQKNVIQLSFLNKIDTTAKCFCPVEFFLELGNPTNVDVSF